MLDDIVDEQYLHTPKDIPYSHAAHYKANPGYDEQLVQIARWNIDQLYQAKIHDYLWIVEHQIEFAKTALTQYVQYIRTAQKSRELFAALYRTIDLTRRVNALWDLPAAADIFEADLLFTLKAVFCSKFGLNLRNENAHGLLSDHLHIKGIANTASATC